MSTEDGALPPHSAQTDAGPSNNTSSPLAFRLTKLLAGTDVEDCYDPEFARVLAVSYASGVDGTYEAQQAERKLKAKFKEQLNLTQFRAGIKAAKTAILNSAPPPEARAPGYLPDITISSRQLREVSEAALAGLAGSNDPPVLFLRAGDIVHITRDQDGRPSISRATESWLRGMLTRSANYLRINQYGELKGAFPPIDIVRDIMACNPAELLFPRLNSLVEVATLRPDGTIIDQPGYDRISAIFYAPAPDLKPLTAPMNPTQQEARAAIDMIEEAIGQFPFADDASKANLYGLLLTPVMRPAIRGCTPLAVIDAPQAATGKSLLVDVISLITVGRPSAMVPYPYKEEEMVKQLGASLAAGRSVIAFDNLVGELRSPALALALTAKVYEARILGLSKNMTVPNVATWIVTGNNIRPAGDMPRRCYQIRLNAKQARPQLGRKYKHPDLLDWVLAHRAELLNALLVLARFWYAAGCPAAVEDAIGSYEDWHRKIGGILQRAHVSGFLGNYVDFLEQEDESPRQWEGFLAHLFEIWKSASTPDYSRWFSIADLMERILFAQQSPLWDALPAEIADRLKKVNHRVVIGKIFGARRERRFGCGAAQYWLERQDPKEDESKHKGAAVWRVRCERAAATARGK